MLVNALVQPRFDYAANFWFRSIGKVNQKKLQICQNKCIRFIHNLDNRAHLEPKHFKSVNMLNVQNRIDYLSLCQLYKIVNNKSPVYLKSLIPEYKHSYDTKSGGKAIFVPRVGSQGQKSFSYNAIKMWNDLPNNISHCNSIDQFKKNCKSFLFNKYESEYNSEYIKYY